MLVLLVVLLFLVTASLLVIAPAIWGWGIYDRYRGSRAVTCPETHRQVAVNFDAVHAAVTGITHTKPDLRLADCTRWPARARCGQDCIPEAVRARPYKQHEVARAKEKRIYHLPVVMAAFVAWVVGAIWHSQFVFRGRWGQALGLDPLEVRRMVRWWSPHLTSVAVVLLFAYGVAWLVALSGRKGLWRGIAVSVALWASLTAASAVGLSIANLPADILWIELGYTFLASLIIGAIIGGLSGRLVEARFVPQVSR